MLLNVIVVVDNCLDELYNVSCLKMYSNNIILIEGL